MTTWFEHYHGTKKRYFLELNRITKSHDSYNYQSNNSFAQKGPSGIFSVIVLTVF